MRLLKAAGAAAVLAALILVPPWALTHFIGNPWPAEGISLSAPLTDGAIIGLLAVLVWLLWVQLMACIIVEAIAAITDDRIRLRAPLTLGVQQHLARRLITAVVVVAVTSPATAMAAPTAHAAPAQAPAAAPVTISAPAEQPASTTQHTPAAKPVSRERVDQVHTVTVMRLDSLWSIAERHLGDGDRWPEIAELNEGHTMNDGTRFLAADHIRPGWQLRIPGTHHQHTEAVARPAHEVTVHHGDTLSEIAEEELGDASAYPALFEASKTIRQPDGRRLTDADLILPGWTIKIPGKPAATNPKAANPKTASAPERPAAPQKPATSAPATPVASPTSAPATEEATTPVAATPNPAEHQAPQNLAAVPTPSAAATSQQPAAQAGEDLQEADTGWPVRTAGGVAGLLAAALVGLIGARRLLQRRRRKPGQQLPLPTAAGEVIETEIRAVADELSLDTVDLALRALAASCDQADLPRPALRLARLTGDQLDLYCAEAAALPAPWQATSDPRVWVLTAQDAAGLTAGEDTAAAWPALVTIGHDDDGGLLLINLAQVAPFGIVGAPDAVPQAFTAMALELATAPWAQHLVVTVVAAVPELADVLPGRLRYVPADGAAALLDDVGDRLHLVLDAGRAIGRSQHDELLAGGVVVVTSGWYAGEEALEVVDHDRARLLPAGLDLTPQLVDQRTYDGLLEIMSASLVDPSDDVPATGERVLPFETAPPTADAASDGPGAPSSETEPQAEAHAELDVVDDPITEPAAQPEPEEEPAGSSTDEPASDVRPLNARPNPTPGPETPTTAAEQLHPRLDTGHPVIRLLGPVVDVIGAAQAAPASPTHQQVCTRIAAYLVLHPGRSRQELINAVWGGQRISAGSLDSRISNLRAWLGEDPDGHKYLPVRSLAFSDAITSDWAVFQQLVGPKPAAAPSTALEEALTLVRGRPLEGEPPKHWGFTEYVVSDMTDLISDTAYELARRAYFESNWTKAAHTAAFGVLIDPGNEQLWRLRIHAAHSAGHPKEVAQAINRMRARISELGFDLEDETNELIDALHHHDASTIAEAQQAL